MRRADLVLGATAVTAAFVIGLALLVIVLGGWKILLYLFIGFAALCAAAAGFGWIVYFVLAPRSMFVGFVEEGTGVAIRRAGALHKMLIQVKDHVLDEDGNVVPGKESHPFGGLRWFGWWPVDRVYWHKWSWSHVIGDGSVKDHKDEWLSYILLKQDTYVLRYEGMEDAESVPIEVEVGATLQVFNPVKAEFKVHNWLATITGRLEPRVRDLVAQRPWKQLNKMTGSLGGDLFTGSQSLFTEFLSMYGVKVWALEVRKLDPPEWLRELTLVVVRARRERDRIKTEAAGEAARVKKLLDVVEGAESESAIMLALVQQLGKETLIEMAKALGPLASALVGR